MAFPKVISALAESPVFYIVTIVVFFLNIYILDKAGTNKTVVMILTEGIILGLIVNILVFIDNSYSTGFTAVLKFLFLLCVLAIIGIIYVTACSIIPFIIVKIKNRKIK